MSPAEFLGACAALVGPGKGLPQRMNRFLGFSVSTVKAIKSGVRPVPAGYAVAVTQALAEADRLGGCFRVIAPRLEGVLRDAAASGCDAQAATAAIAAWAALRLSRVRP